MKSEVRPLLRRVRAPDLPAEQLLTANFSYVDTSLAKHYGLPAGGPGRPSPE